MADGKSRSKIAYDKITNREEGKAGDWLAMSIDVGTSKLVYHAEGNGLRSMKNVLDSELALFMAMAIDGVDQRETVTSTRRKILRVDYTGVNVKRALKTIQLNVRGQVRDTLNGTSATLQADCPEELDPKDIVLAIIKAGAAHKPKYYDFGDGKWDIEADVYTEGKSVEVKEVKADPVDEVPDEDVKADPVDDEVSAVEEKKSAPVEEPDVEVKADPVEEVPAADDDAPAAEDDAADAPAEDGGADAPGDE